MRPYNKDNVPLAKQLRKNMTPWERKLWYEFLRGYPVRFRRQVPIGEHIVDFYCSRAKLVIELDGSQHYEEEQARQDAERTKSLTALGLRVVRIPNNEVMSNFEGVCAYIHSLVEDSKR